MGGFSGSRFSTVESGEGIESPRCSARSSEKMSRVESGEGIERCPAQLSRSANPIPEWNPVKELKVDGVEAQDALTPSQWNPVKELKVFDF